MLPALWRRWQVYILLTLLALPALWPLAGPGVPRTNDTLPHLYRAVQLEALVRAGVFWPRWAPDLVHGYGYPVFNFFPYLAHLLVVGLHGLGLSLAGAYNLACGLALLASAWWAFRLGREHFGEAAGLVAGAAYLYSPYLLYDTYVRGSLPENLALACLPLFLLYLGRAARGDRRAGSVAALALAAALLAHHGVMLQAMPFLAAYGVFAWWTGHARPGGAGDPGRAGIAQGGRRAWTVQLYVFLLAFLLAAVFWLPALAEARYVQTERGTGNGGMSYLDNFLTLGDLLRLPRLPVDPALLNPPVVRSLPLAGLLLGGLALLRWAYQRLAPGARRPDPAQAGTLAFFGLAALAAACLIQPVSQPVWDHVPLLRLTLFPWRLLGPISLFVSLAAGALFAAPTEGTTPARGSSGAPAEDGGSASQARRAGKGPRLWAAIEYLLYPAAFLIILGCGLPFASPPREPVPDTPALSDLARFEIPPAFIGTTTVGEYLPVWVRELPDTAPNRDQLLAGQPVLRHEAPGASVTVLETRPGHDRYTVEADGPVTFLYRAFYFPGWQATLDGRPVPIRITTPSGLMTVAVPAGTHTLAFRFGSTPVRIIGAFLSIMGLAATALLLASGRAEAREPLAARQALPAGPRARAAPAGWLLFPLAAALALGRPLLYDGGRTPLLAAGPRPALVLNQDVAGELTLLGADATAGALAADDELRVDLYWMANHPLGIPYGFDVRLVDAAGHTWSQPEQIRPRDWRFTPGTDFWPTDQYILDPYLLQPVPGTPPGPYHVRVEVFARPTLQSIGAFNILDVAVTAPTRARPCPEDDGLGAAGATLWLASVEHSAPAAAPGDDLVVSPCWQVTGPPAAGAAADPPQATLRLLDNAGRAVVSQAFTIGAPYPAADWEAGDVLRDQVDVRLPAALETGRYTWTLAPDGGGPFKIGSVQVNAPERAFAPPPVDTILEADLGALRLYGASLAAGEPARGADWPLTLTWQADTLLLDSYHVFVHLLAADGSLAAQSDGVPAAWTRRTTGWLPGEYVTDARAVFLRPDLAPGVYQVWAGVYLPGTGERLTTGEFPEGRILVGEVRVN